MGLNIKQLIYKFTRFAKVGFFVTLLSLGLSYFFLKIIGTPLILTYVLLYISMIFLSFYLNSFYTFKAERNLKRLFLYYGSYGFSMLLGVFLLSIFRKTFPFENWVLAYLVIPFTMTSNFVLSSFIFKTKNG
jgi:putative flippase GtrA